MRLLCGLDAFWQAVYQADRSEALPRRQAGCPSQCNEGGIRLVQAVNILSSAGARACLIARQT
ncbi:MAG: hypothetical protein AB9834_01300 [Lentimicrobium sp.]